MDAKYLQDVIESLLFVSQEPVTLARMMEVIGRDAPRGEIEAALDELKDKYSGRALQLRVVGEGYQLSTRPEFAEYIKGYHKITRGTKLSRAGLESLAIIAYKQPLTRAELEEIRGVDSSGVLKTLLDKNLIKPRGRKNVPGKPMSYGTTRRFLEYFGLKDLSELPSLREIEDELGLDQETRERLGQLTLDLPAGASGAVTELEPLTPEDLAEYGVEDSDLDEDTDAELDEEEYDDDDDEYDDDEEPEGELEGELEDEPKDEPAGKDDR